MILRKLYDKTNKEVIGLTLVLLMSLVVCGISVRINIFRYNNFDFGKFDLGNMTQMVWNTMRGRVLYLTDYFGGNVPRWSMSHVDPILLMFVPLFAIFPHPLTLVFAQLALTSVVAPIALFKISKLVLKSNLASTLIALAYLLYPALGYLNTQTGFHGVSAAIPFFLLSAYLVEKMFRTQNFSAKYFVALWISAIITMTGKEQLPLYIGLLCVFGLVWRTPLPQNTPVLSKSWIRAYLKHPMSKNLIALLIVSVIWLVLAFFVIIPQNARYRIESYRAFTQEVGVDTELTNDVISENYFLSRYRDLGDSYGTILLGMISDPKRFVNIIFGGDKLDNFSKTFFPVLFLPFLAPQILMTAMPDLLINYSTTAGGIGTSEISNHRISMIIPVVFLSTIFAVSTLSRYLALAWEFAIEKLFFLPKKQVKPKRLAWIFALAIVSTNIYTTFAYNNPVFLWFTQAISKRLLPSAEAKFDREVNLKKDLKLGDRFKISGLENKDRECARMIISLIPADASVSGPDYLGAHLAQRETYAIFPALYSKADFVIVDVFSQKIMRILDTDISLVRDVVGDMVTNPNYQNAASCGNLFVFKKSEPQGKSLRLPIQERYKYAVDQNLEIFDDLFLADFNLPAEITRGVPSKATFVYRKESKKPDAYVLFTSFINAETGKIYQSANIPSYGLTNIEDWNEGYYYIENIDLNAPAAVEPGIYHVFIGITNNIRTRSIYLQEIKIN